MIDICLYSHHEDYDEMKAQLGLYVGAFEYQDEVAPFMLPYRKCDIYVIDIEGMSHERADECLSRLTTIIAKQSTLVLIWSTHTWNLLREKYTSASLSSNCIYADQVRWYEEVNKEIRKRKRLQRERKNNKKKEG